MTRLTKFWGTVAVVGILGGSLITGFEEQHNETQQAYEETMAQVQAQRQEILEKQKEIEQECAEKKAEIEAARAENQKRFEENEKEYEDTKAKIAEIQAQNEAAQADFWEHYNSIANGN